MPGLAGLPFGSPHSSYNTFSTDSRLDPILDSFVQRFQKIEKAEQEKSSLLKEVINQYACLSHQLRDQGRGTAFSQPEYHDDLVAFYNDAASRPYVAMVLNGECMLFNDDFIVAGSQGGHRAGEQLLTFASRYAKETLPQFFKTEHVKLLATYCLNSASLDDAARNAGLVHSTSTIHDFMSGMNEYSRAHLDAIDMRNETSIAEKMSSRIAHHLEDIQCQMILVGCGATDILVPYLSRLTPDQSKRLTIIQGLSRHESYSRLSLATVLFGRLFRTEPYPQSESYPQYVGSPTSQPPGLSSPKSSSASPESDLRADTPCFSERPTVETWASKVKCAMERSLTPSPAAPAAPLVLRRLNTISSRPATPSSLTRDDDGILWSQAGHRVDEPVKVYNKDEVNRIKKMKLCNVHYLRPPCPYGSGCGHKHDFRPVKGEIATLRLVARMAPCMNGSQCEDAECIYGHTCPAPDRKDGKPLEGKPCIFGRECRYTPEMHFRG